MFTRTRLKIRTWLQSPMKSVAKSARALEWYVSIIWPTSHVGGPNASQVAAGPGLLPAGLLRPRSRANSASQRPLSRGCPWVTSVLVSCALLRSGHSLGAWKQRECALPVGSGGAWAPWLKSGCGLGCICLLACPAPRARVPRLAAPSSSVRAQLSSPGLVTTSFSGCLFCL